MPQIFRHLSRPQLTVLALFLLGWLGFSLVVPEGSSVDVYLFRDAVVNLSMGHGFTTASFEKSTSFTPVLYSSYTPLVQWLFLPFAALVHPLWRAGSVYEWTLAALATLLVLDLALPYAANAFQRWVLVLLLGFDLPVAFIVPEPDRPEALSFVLLLLLLRVLRGSASTVVRYSLAGLLAGFAFLSEPFAGVLAVLLIAGAALVASFAGRSGPAALTSLLTLGVVSGALFAAPVLTTAAVYSHIDPSALKRFQAQAKYAGTQRPIEYKMSADQTDADLARIHDSFPQKLKSGFASDARSLPTLLRLVGFVALAFGTLLLAALAAAPSPLLKFAAIAVLLLIVLLPIAAFPLQPNYRALDGSVVFAALAAGWAALRVGRGAAVTVWALFVVQGLVAFPSASMGVVSRVEVRPSYFRALDQARAAAAYLDAHGLHDAVLLTPPNAYYAYKPFHTRLYNEAYYAHIEGTDAIGGLVECKNASRNTSPEPLPPSLPGDWLLLSHDDQPVFVSLAGHRLMRNNWSMGCDVYVRRQP